MIKRFSVIYIGSIRCELIVGQRGKGCIKILDRAMFPINFGSQSFTKGEISFKSVYALCQTINEYIEMSKTYGVESIKIFGTTALREARNRLYILEQIKINTGGYEVEILDKEDNALSAFFKYVNLKNIEPDKVYFMGLFIYHLMDREILQSDNFLENYEGAVRIFLECRRVIEEPKFEGTILPMDELLEEVFPAKKKEESNL